ncbi:MAG: cysteine hydrolase family protein [bacterium]|nr:cysteine hydrolase family protein [bacterium]
MKSALLVIDVQNEYFTGARPVSYPPESLDNILKTMAAAHTHGLPVLLIQHAARDPEATAFRQGSHGWELMEQVAAQPHDALIHKNFPGSFTGTELENELRSRGIEKVALCGYMTHMCCDTTARQAFHRGFKVDFLSDATGTLNLTNSAGTVSAEQIHKTILAVQQSVFSRVISTNDWLAEC